MEFEILGPVQVRRDDQVIAPAGRLQRSLLGLLLLNANRPVNVDLLSDVLWSDRADERAPQKLQVHVHRLRNLLGEPDRISYGPSGYRLRVFPGELDVERFETLVDEAVEFAWDDPFRCAKLIRKALELWTATPYGGLDIPLLRDEVHRLSERRLAAFEELFQAELASGRHAAIISEITDLIHQHPLRERLYALLMTAMHKDGRQADALAIYRQARSVLVAELGLDPGAELQALERTILSGEPVTVGNVPAPAVPPAQLPHDVSEFVGRAGELSELDCVLSVQENQPPALVITGEGGVGKTALAVRWAYEVRERFPDGQLYADLAGYGPDRRVEPTDVLAGFLRALGVDGNAIPRDPVERAARFRTLLNGKRTLVVLDNAQSAEQVRPILPGDSPSLVVVTSRDELAGLIARDGARRIHLGRLGGGDARVLMRRLLGQEFTADDEPVDALVERCARLPLALRVAAESVRGCARRSVSDLVAELADERSRLDVFDVANDPDTSIRAVFSFSYRQLPSDAARLFRLIGLHPGRDLCVYAMAALAECSLTRVRRLVTVLLRAHLIEATSYGHYRQHDLLRAYAFELVEEEESAEKRRLALERFLAHYLNTAARARRALDPAVRAIPGLDERDKTSSPELRTRDQAWEWFAAQRTNMIAVTHFAAENANSEAAARLAACLLDFYYVSKHWDEWITTHEAALSAARYSGDQTGQSIVLSGLGVAYDDVYRHDEAISCHKAAARLHEELDDPQGAAWNMNNLGVVYDNLGRFAEAIDCYRKALDVFDAVGDWRGVGIALNNLGDVHRQRKEFGISASYLRKALATQRSTGDQLPQRFTLRTVGDLYSDSGRARGAIAAYRSTVAISRELGERWRVAAGLTRLASELREVGNVPEAIDCLREAIAIFDDFRHPAVDGVREALATLEVTSVESVFAAEAEYV